MAFLLTPIFGGITLGLSGAGKITGSQTVSSIADIAGSSLEFVPGGSIASHIINGPDVPGGVKIGGYRIISNPNLSNRWAENGEYSPYVSGYNPEESEYVGKWAGLLGGKKRAPVDPRTWIPIHNDPANVVFNGNGIPTIVNQEAPKYTPLDIPTLSLQPPTVNETPRHIVDKKRPEPVVITGGSVTYSELPEPEPAAPEPPTPTPWRERARSQSQQGTNAVYIDSSQNSVSVNAAGGATGPAQQLISGVDNKYLYIGGGLALVLLLTRR